MVVDLVIPEAGLYPFVTHSFPDASKGAMGVIKVTHANTDKGAPGLLNITP